MLKQLCTTNKLMRQKPWLADALDTLDSRVPRFIGWTTYQPYGEKQANSFWTGGLADPKFIPSTSSFSWPFCTRRPKAGLLVRDLSLIGFLKND